MALWNFFSEGTTNGASALLARADLLTKTVVPRQIMVYAALMSAALTFVINLAVLLVVLQVTGTPIGLPALLFPVLLVDLALLTLGMRCCSPRCTSLRESAICGTSPYRSASG